MFLPGIIPPNENEHPRLWMLVQNGRVLFSEKDSALAGEDEAEQLPFTGAEHFIGTLDGNLVWTAGIADETKPVDGWSFYDLFSVHGMTSEETWMAAGRAVQVIEWERTNRFCGRCGIANELVTGERALRCPQCHLLRFPQLSPAIITLVHRDDEVLLARSHRFPEGLYSALAGFVEPGETVEGALIREVKEEVGLQVKNLEYQSSQPWPFPNSLMLGFFAEYESGDIVLEEAEIAAADWFPVKALPNIPGSISIANRLITSWVARYNKS
ncbi:MAG: NAD(+) diphosphatase [Dehalococcoidia bacterium]|nr:NAD(+) diphosphatase [Dehalococcoidia bacterium]HCU99848.1 NAD(+) diphosphatase [Dehalococcoidia bacterium]|tara:strand:- start:13653 stop:14462 length:810 start_codon:yes stop_codon:yes gene_type:complete